MLKVAFNSIVCLLLLISASVTSQELPPIQNFLPGEYGGETQNWSVSQSNDKKIYVANNNGMLEYDGAKWNLYPSPNNTFIRAIKVIDDRVYTGCFREFGYWIRDEFGKLRYQSLIGQLNEPLHEDEHIWNILSFDKWILFQSLHRIYIYNTELQTFNIIRSSTQLPKAFKVGDGIYFQKVDQGIYKIENGQPVLISDHPILKKNILVNIFIKDRKLLLQTQTSGSYFLENNQVIKWDVPANSLFDKVTIFSSLRLKNGNFIIGTISNGIYLISSEGNIIYNINQKKGLANNTVLSLFEDLDQNLWLGLDNGISMINMNSPFLIYHDTEGLLGSVYAALMYEDELYVGTNQGLFHRKDDSEVFEFVEGTKGQVWCLKIYDNSLFCGHNIGTFEVKNGVAELIAPIMGTWDILPVKDNPNILLQGNYNGLNTLEKVNGKWQFRSVLQGFDISSRYFGFDSEMNIFVSHEWKGIFKLEVNDDFTKVLGYRTVPSSEKRLKSSLVTYHDDLLYTTEEGVFKYNEQQELFLNVPVLSINLFAHDNYVSGKLIADKAKNRLWGFTDKNIVYFSPAKLNNDLRATKISLPAESRQFVTSYESVTHLRDELYIFGTTRGYALLDLDKITSKEFDIEINSIDKSILNNERTSVILNTPGTFEYRENNLYFNYSVSEYDKYYDVHYQYQLEGMYDEWSEWTTIPTISFENLPFGDYTFRVRARIGAEASRNTATYSFTIDRPFLLSNFMLAIYAFFFVSVLFLIHLLYRRHYNKQEKKSIEKKQRAFELEQLENERVIMKLKNDKLKHDIESKSRELAASTMSIVKKNELLNTIKNELGKVNDAESVRPVITIINQNLTDTSDWEMFQEAFNNADTGFLKKIKSEHPNLTPNDLRLCAYLRLNLSSKEIAPLLNISSRSVEIKRYRLRKKMELPHEKSLVEYILEI